MRWIIDPRLRSPHLPWGVVRPGCARRRIGDQGPRARARVRGRAPWGARWAIAALALTLGACAFDPGQPWGEVDFEVQAAFAPEDRATPDGRVETSRSTLVQIDRLELTLDSVSLSLAASEAAVGFDPASPPPGFSLCHNGHCHSADGRLVPFEDVAAEAAVAAGVAAEVVQAIEAALPLSTTPVAAPLGDCSGACQLEEPGALNAVKLRLGRVLFEGRVFDALEGGARRLPEEGVAVRFSVPVDLDLRASVSGEVGKDDPIGIEVAVDLKVRSRFFDAVDFVALVQGVEPDAQGVVDLSAAGRSAVSTGIGQQSQVTVTVKRRTR